MGSILGVGRVDIDSRAVTEELNEVAGVAAARGFKLQYLARARGAAFLMNKLKALVNATEIAALSTENSVTGTADVAPARSSLWQFGLECNIKSTLTTHCISAPSYRTEASPKTHLRGPRRFSVLSHRSTALLLLVRFDKAV